MGKKLFIVLLALLFISLTANAIVGDQDGTIVQNQKQGDANNNGQVVVLLGASVETTMINANPNTKAKNEFNEAISNDEKAKSNRYDEIGILEQKNIQKGIYFEKQLQRVLILKLPSSETSYVAEEEAAGNNTNSKAKNEIGKEERVVEKNEMLIGVTEFL